MNKKRKRSALILAAGRGKRMGVDSPKCLVKVFDKTMIEMVIDNIKKAGIDDITIVLGYKALEVLKVVGDSNDICYQKELLGTANAVLSAKEKYKDKNVDLLIIASDMPFISYISINEAFDVFRKEKADILLMTSTIENDNNYGRVIKDKCGNVIEIVERKDLKVDMLNIKEVNASVYIVKSEDVFDYLKDVKNDNNQNEYYFTDVIKIYNTNKKKILSYTLKDNREIIGVNCEKDLFLAKDMFEENH